MSVTDVRKTCLLSFKPLSNVPFLIPHLLCDHTVQCSHSTSEERSTLLVLVNKKHNSRGSKPLIQIKKLLLHWLDFPSREISTATTFCVRQRSTASGPVWIGVRPSNGNPPARKSLFPPKSTSYMFLKKTRGIRLLVKFTI